MLAVATILSVATAFAAGAAQFTIATSVPGVSSSASPSGWIENFYTFALLVGGILAFGAIAYGGVKYAFAHGNASGESEAKAWIWSALLGLLLLGSAYIILDTVNPNLVTLALPNVGEVNLGTPVSDACGGCPNGGTCNGGTCIGAGGAVYCGGTIRGQCPSGEDCVNSGGILSSASYSCVSSNPASYTCGKPSAQYGSCEQGYSCFNDAGPGSPPYYSCGPA